MEEFIASTSSNMLNSVSRSESQRSGNQRRKSIKKGNKKSDKQKVFEVDYIGTGTFQVSQLNLLETRSVEPFKSADAKLSARGLHHRNVDIFKKEISTTSTVISLLMRSERKIGGKYVPSPQLFLSHFQRALAYERMKEIDKAIADYTFCIDIDEKSSAAYFNRSGLYKLKGNMDNAMSDMNKAVLLAPANVKYREARSLLFRQSGKYLEAINDTLLGRAVERNPQLGKTLEAGGDVKLDGDLQYVKKLEEDPIITALSIPGDSRTPKDIEAIVDFIKEVKFFSSFASNRPMLAKIARKISLTSVRKGKFIFEEGEVGEHFYIILEGEVSIVKVRIPLDGPSQTVT